MIISYAKNFIFMHSRKTAGSTITAALNKHLGDEDIQIGAWPDTIAADGAYNKLARQIARSQLGTTLVPSLKYSLKHLRPSLSPLAVNNAVRIHYQSHGLPAGTHSAAADAQAFDPAHWEKAFKFAFVRNPWSHAVSDYNWRCFVIKDKSVDFKEYLYRLEDLSRPDPEGIRPPVISNWPIYTINDEIALDHVARYEDLKPELKYISEKLGFEINIDRINSKGKVRNKSKPIESYYDAEAIELVREVYRAEVDAFDYQPITS